MLLDEIESEPEVAVAWLEKIYRRDAARKNFSRDLAEAVASGSPALEHGGAWLMRRLVDEKGPLPPADWELTVDGLAGVRSWVARLLLCQLLAGHPEMTESAPEAIAGFLRECADGPNIFVRAWAVTAFHALGKRHRAYGAEAKRCLTKARKDPAKSMQARLRHLT